MRGLISFQDPAGNRLEAFNGAEIDDTPFSPGRSISGFRTGPLGSGHAMKALNNYVSAAGLAAAVEALAVGQKFGLDPAVMTGDYIDMHKLDPVGRLNGFFYTKLGEVIERTFDDSHPR